MTENNARVFLTSIKEDNNWGGSMPKALEIAIKALEDIEKYRAMEKKLNGISLEQVVKGFLNTVEKETGEEYTRGRILTNEEADKWYGYLSLGSVEDFQKAKTTAGAFNQVKWERDVAISQLEEIGVSLGQKMDDVKQEIRNVIITEFVEKLKAEYKPCKETDGEIYESVCNRFDKIAEEIRDSSTESALEEERSI